MGRKGKGGRPLLARVSGVAATLILLGLSIPVVATPAAGDTATTARSTQPELRWAPRNPPRFPLLFLYQGQELSDPIEQLLDEAEASLRRGEEHYQAGHLDHARKEFDHAVDLLLTSGYSLEEDPRLRFGFDRLVDRIHELERRALSAAAAEEEPPEVPASIEEIQAIAPLTFPLDPEIRARVEKELATLAHDLPLTINDRVLRMVNFFQTVRGRRIIQNGLRRAGRYRELITRALEEEQLPRDLIYIAQAESAFQPHARSRARAVGLWQFMSFRGREYGLEIDWWVDERRDPVKATRAAARHLKDLYEQFGDWYLVMAAYNSGPGRVERALRRAGGEKDFWTLIERRLLPRETRNYVPIVLAMALVAKDPARYGVEVEPEPPLRYEVVTVDKPVDLRRIAEVIDVDVAELRALNPHLLRNVTPPKRDDFQLYVPPGTAQTLVAELPRIPESQRVLWQRHRVRRGETLSHLAARYGISSYAIAQANGISLRSIIRIGQVLVIPTGGGAGRASYSSGPQAVEQSDGTLVYRVRRGDSLSVIAARHGVSVGALARANGLSLRSIIRPGDRLVIPGRSGSARRRASASRSSSRPSGSYRVRRGDTLSGIASRHRVSTRALARANGLSLRSVIRPGDRLVIPGASGSSAASRRSAGPQTHRVRRGDTLWELARRYDVSVADLRRANPFLRQRRLQAGDHLTIPH